MGEPLFARCQHGVHLAGRGAPAGDSEVKDCPLRTLPRAVLPHCPALRFKVSSSTAAGKSFIYAGPDFASDTFPRGRLRLPGREGHGLRGVSLLKTFIKIRPRATSYPFRCPA